MPLRRAVDQYHTVLYSALRDGPITLELADLGGDFLGLTDYAARRITLEQSLSPAAMRTTLVHEVVHLSRGPVLPHQAAAEEREVERITAELLIPDADVLAARDQPWSDREVHALAARRVVDAALVREALNPPTVKLCAVTPRPITQHTVALAARPTSKDTP